jgi:hypothetical protein
LTIKNWTRAPVIYPLISARLQSTHPSSGGDVLEFKVFHDRIETPGDGIVIFQGAIGRFKRAV